MAFKRTYRFNWLDHLYYTGKGCPAQWSVWFYVESFFVSTPLALLILCAVAMLIDQSWNTALICVAICAGCVLAIISYSGWLLRKRRFTPQREKAYFRHYPKRKNYCNTLISIGAFLTNSLLVGFLIYHLLKWVTTANN